VRAIVAGAARSRTGAGAGAGVLACGQMASQTAV
jgi:hypothetical protein